MGGNAKGANLRTDNYSVNNLNQVTAHDTPGYVDIIGAATATNTVTVNSNPTYRHGEFYQYALSIPNGSSPVWQRVTNVLTGTGISSNGYVLYPPAGQAFGYDSDGNLTGDGVWNYQWDAENRLMSMNLNKVKGVSS